MSKPLWRSTRSRQLEAVCGSNTATPISWDDFFKKFDKNGLAMLYEDTTADGEVSTFYQFVSRDTLEAETDKSA